MNDRRKTKAQLIKELTALRQQVEQLRSPEQTGGRLPKRTATEPVDEQHTTLEKIAENVPGMIYQFILHPDGQTEFPYVSSGSRQVYGLEPEVIINDSSAILDIVHPEDVAAFQQSIADSARTLAKWEWEGRVILPSGQTKWISGSSMPEKLTNGDILWSGVVLDIGERKQVEARLAKWAVELEAVAQVGVAASTILDVDTLLQRVVDLTKERFDLYHAHIYVLDETEKTLDLAAGAGAVGQEMVTQGWQIPLEQEQSLVAGVARHKQGVIVNDVRATPDWLPNPLLPETRAELAVPMIIGQQLVGVLDIQADHVDYFTEEDIRIQTILAGQIAVALQNARLFAHSRRRAEQERLVNQVTQKIQGTVTVESALQMAVKELGQALQARQTRVELIPKNEDADRMSPDNGDR